jgi:hypothetical protein
MTLVSGVDSYGCGQRVFGLHQKSLSKRMIFSGCGIVSCDITWYLGDTNAASIFTASNMYFSDLMLFSAGKSVQF